MIELGILLALVCALATNIAFLCKHRGAVAAPDVSFLHPLRSAAGLFRSRWWAIGIGIAVVGWTFHVAALALAPLSLVQVVIAGGLVLLAYPAERWFGFKLGAREWLGLSLSAAGLVLLAVTTDLDGNTTHSTYSMAGMIGFEAFLVVVGVALLGSHRIERVRERHGELLAVAAGLLIGVSDISIKALTGSVGGGILELLSPWTAVALVASLLAFFAIGRGLQLGDGISVIAISSVAANCSTIAGGVLVFGDPVGQDPLGIVVRGLAFIAVVAAAALMPGPTRAAHAAS
jgi:hypothetical protein